jgi:sec-independent protein translocase protein TatB
MFDIGFLELVIVGIIALLVLGPERLPVAARTVGKWVGRARRMTSQFTKEIDRQIELDELRAELKAQGESLDIRDDANKIHATVSEALQQAKEFEPLPRTEEDKPFSHDTVLNNTATSTASATTDTQDSNTITAHQPQSKTNQNTISPSQND